MSYQPVRRWWCFSLDLEDWAVGSETYCQFGRHGEHSVVCGWKVLVDADSWRLRSDFAVTPIDGSTP